MTAPLQARPRGVTLQMRQERVLLVPADVALVFDRNGWHAEAIPRDELDIEALCEAQDLEDAAWFAEQRHVVVAVVPPLRAPVKRAGRHRRRKRK